jgi:hypothetical protein
VGEEAVGGAGLALEQQGVVRRQDRLQGRLVVQQAQGCEEGAGWQGVQLGQRGQGLELGQLLH